MRQIQVTTPAEKSEEIVGILDEAGVEYAVTEEVSGREPAEVFSFPVRTDEVEGILESLKNAGVGDEGKGKIVVTEVQAVVSEDFEEKEEEEKRKDDEDGNGERIARDELRTTAKGISRSTPNYVAFTVISAVVATAGMIENSAAVVVGSMVIAPLIGPAMASSVGSVLKDDRLFYDGIKTQFVGIGVAIASAAVFALAVRLLVVPELELLAVGQIAERVNPGVLALAVALGAGVAGALSLTSGASAALVGVMIAVALIPPAAAVGLGVAYVRPGVAASAGVLVFVNVLSINLAALVVLWAKGYRPEKWYDKKPARRVTQKRVVALILIVGFLSFFLVASTADDRARAAFEDDVEEYVDGLDETAEVGFTHTVGFFSTSPERVTVETREELDPDSVAEGIEEETGETVEVVVIRREIEFSQTAR